MINKWLLIIYFFCCAIYAQQKICIGSIKNYSVDLSENNGDGSLGSTYNWSISSPFSGTITAQNSSKNKVVVDWENSAPGGYTIRVEEVNSSGCVKETTLLVQILQDPKVNIEDQIACLNANNQWVNTPIFNTNLSPTTHLFEWFFNGTLLSNTAPSLIPTQVGTYKVIVTNKITQCSAFDEAVVIESPQLVGGTSVSEDFTNRPQIEAIVSGGIGPYLYSLDGINYQSSSIFNVSESGYFTVYVKDQSECSVLKLPACVYTYNKFFTPNYDGFNDRWTIKIPIKGLKSTVTIFDRFGKLIKRFDPSIDSWDGTLNNRELFSTDYWFVIDYINCSGEAKQFKSHFALKR